MTAYSKAAKKRSKRGKHTKHFKYGPRTPSGQLSRSKWATAARASLTKAQEQALEEETMRPVLTRRAEMVGCTPEEAKDRLLGSFVGRLLKSGEISITQFKAAEKYHQVRDAEKRALEIRGQRSASDYSGVGGYDSSDGTDEEYVAWCKRSIAEAKKARSAITSADPMGQMACEGIIIEDQEMNSSVSELRVALNALARLWRISDG